MQCEGCEEWACWKWPPEIDKTLYNVKDVRSGPAGTAQNKQNHIQILEERRRSPLEHIGQLARMSVLDTEVDGSNPGSSMLFPWARHSIRIASVDSAVKWVLGGDNLVKDVQCYELFGGIALINHAFSLDLYNMWKREEEKRRYTNSNI